MAFMTEATLCRGSQELQQATQRRLLILIAKPKKQRACRAAKDGNRPGPVFRRIIGQVNQDLPEVSKAKHPGPKAKQASWVQGGYHQRRIAGSEQLTQHLELSVQVSRSGNSASLGLKGFVRGCLLPTAAQLQADCQPPGKVEFVLLWQPRKRVLCFVGGRGFDECFRSLRVWAARLGCGRLRVWVSVGGSAGGRVLRFRVYICFKTHFSCTSVE